MLLAFFETVPSTKFRQLPDEDIEKEWSLFRSVGIASAVECMPTNKGREWLVNRDKRMP